MLEIIRTKDLMSSAELTLDNMKPYYEMYEVDWGLSDVYRATAELSNFDIIRQGERIGVLRLSFDNQRCQLRDIQIASEHQSKGYGRQVILMVIEITKERRLQHTELKVFKRSPAYKLYRNMGFQTDKEDDRFYYMSIAVD